LVGACLERVDFTNADLASSVATEAVFRQTILSNADLSGAILDSSFFDRTNVAGAKLNNASVANTIYAPDSEAPGSFVGTLRNLTTIKYWLYDIDDARTALACNGTADFGQWPRGLSQLRKILADAGDNQQEREATFAIEHGKTTQMLGNSYVSFDDINLDKGIYSAMLSIYHDLFDNREWLSAVNGVLEL
jgi:uncharacterized protein YjbI with pentapeptide repeats